MNADKQFIHKVIQLHPIIPDRVAACVALHWNLELLISSDFGHISPQQGESLVAKIKPV